MGLPAREGAEGLISEELINRLRDTSGVGDPAIARLRQRIPIIPLARLEHLTKARDDGTEVAAVYFDPAQDAVCKVYAVEGGEVIFGYLFEQPTHHAHSRSNSPRSARTACLTKSRILPGDRSPCCDSDLIQALAWSDV